MQEKKKRFHVREESVETLRQMVELSDEASSTTCKHGCTQGLILCRIKWETVQPSNERKEDFVKY